MPTHDPNDAQEGHDAKEHSILEPVSAAPGHATPENIEADAETVGEGTGGFLGGVSGLAIGAAAGPVGALVGGLAGLLGGWWAGREVAHALTDDDDRFYRTQYDHAADRLADRGYEQVRPAYVAGHLAGRNPDYSGRSFDEIEGDLGRAWDERMAEQRGQWAAVRGYARTAFERARRTTSSQG
jgi:hypothetical protein